MTTKNGLPFSNQFERGHSFNWAGKWTSGKYYMNDEYVTDFIVYESAILVCRKSHLATDELKPIFVYQNGKIVDVDSPYWGFIVAVSDGSMVVSSEYIPKATAEDKALDPSVIIGDPYIKIVYSSGAYTYIPTKDLVVGINVGIPIMTQEMLDKLPPESKPEDYILMAQESDITDAVGGNYLSILFSAIRKLQAEVAKLRNSFEFGIESYKGKSTAVSGVIEDYSDVEQDEPLWSIDETDLSEIPEATIDFYAPTIDLQPLSNVEYTGEGFANITGTASWSDINEGYASIEDTKIFLYLTTSGTNINVILNGTKTNSVLNLNLKNILHAFNTDKYNICVLVSRKMVAEDEQEYGKNYIWISASYFNTNVTVAEGYYNVETGNLQGNMYEIDNSYTINSVNFTNLKLTKFNAYSQYQDFSHEVIPSKPSDQDYKYKTAHITIRSVDTLDELQEVEDRLLVDELIYQTDKGILWIKTKNGLASIGSGGSPEGGMTVTEMLEELRKRGLVYNDNGVWSIADVSDITFINNQTNKRFKFDVSAEGQLRGQEVASEDLAKILEDLTNPPVSSDSEIRGFIGKLHLAQDGVSANYSKDAGLDADRVKIGAVYCPLSSDTKHGCSHGYIELENTSDRDIPLSGCFLHYYHPDSTRTPILNSLELTGILPAGGTYLVRCKKYADPELNADVFINVKTYDQEWYVDGSPLDLTIDQEYTIVGSDKVPNYSYVFILTYGDKVGGSTITANTNFMTTDGSGNTIYVWNFIDILPIDKRPNNSTGWGAGVAASRANSIIRNTFELDPAKQAYQALYAKDSSRTRLAKIANDIQYLDLTEEYIEFPITSEKYRVDKFTPKASFEHKNVCTDKSKIDVNKPNMVTCSFGRNLHTSRCFNWISAGEFDEYVFIKDGASWLKFESYKEQNSDETESGSYPRRAEFSAQIVNNIYKRMTGNFPGDGTHYTAHKCIIHLSENAPLIPTEYTYVVGRADKNGNPDLEHCSDEYTFTTYPTSYAPRIYQITDQQGFHWIEYQVWAAAALELSSKINTEVQNEQIIPILINTGDMTQNGTRINEWFDYYNAGKELFNHLEQMNVVGNNDLCNTDPNALGTGDDNGKSNGYYFHVFYCYEIDPLNVPLIPDGSKYNYIPSLYYFDSENYRFVMINSEITYVNCDKWFNKHKNNDVVNIYTGWTVPSSAGGTAIYDNSFTSIYSMIYKMLYEGKTVAGKNIIAVCHEMPFTVITKDSLETTTDVYKNYRSFGGSGSSLIGSHTNQLNSNDNTGIFWLSRLLEYFHIKLMIGGHKHTYACTFPLREYYFYYDLDENMEVTGVQKNSKDDGIMTMYETLEHDNRVSWLDENQHNTSKFPLCKYSVSGDTDTGTITWGETGTMNVFAPRTIVNGLTGGVTYMMCQATGYKLTSNKELPSNWQCFSNVIPKTTIGNDGSDKADNAQKAPMFTVVDMNGDNYTVKLIKLLGILNSGYGFTQINNTPLPVNVTYKYASVSAPAGSIAPTRYATWGDESINLISI